MPPESDAVERTTASRPQAATAAFVPTATAVGAERAEMDGRRTVGRKREGSGSSSSMRTAKQQKTSAGDGTSAFQAGAVSGADGTQDSGLSSYERVSAVAMAPVSGDQQRSSTEVRVPGDTQAEGSHGSEIEVSRILKRFEDALKKAEQTPEKVMTLQKKLDLAEQDAKTAGIRADEAAKRETRNRAEHAKLLQESDEHNKKLSREHEKLQAEYKEMSESKHKLFVENMTRRITNESFADAMKEFSIVEEKLKQATKEKTDLAEKLRQAETARGEADNELARLKETLTSMEAERDSAKAELDKVREKLTSMEAARDSVTTELEGLRSTVASIEVMRNPATAEVNQRREELSSSQKDVSKERLDVQGLTTVLNGLKTAVEAIKARPNGTGSAESDWQKAVELLASRLNAFNIFDDGSHLTHSSVFHEVGMAIVRDAEFDKPREFVATMEVNATYCFWQVVEAEEGDEIIRLENSKATCPLHTMEKRLRKSDKCLRFKCIVRNGDRQLIVGRKTKQVVLMLQ